MDGQRAAALEEGVNFVDVERDWVVGRIYADFRWRPYDEFSPYNPLRVPLSRARVAIVTTAGAHLADQEPFDIDTKSGDPSYRAFPSATSLSDIQLTHTGYDTRRAALDPNVVLPLDHLHAAVQDGQIGELAPNVYSCMGYVADTDPFIQVSAPEIAARLADDQVDLVLLAPT